MSFYAEGTTTEEKNIKELKKSEDNKEYSTVKELEEVKP